MEGVYKSTLIQKMKKFQSAEGNKKLKEVRQDRFHRRFYWRNVLDLQGKSTNAVIRKEERTAIKLKPSMADVTFHEVSGCPLLSFDPFN